MSKRRCTISAAWLYVCVYICMYVCVCIYVCTYVIMCIYHRFSGIHASLGSCLDRVHIYVILNTHTHMYIHIHHLCSDSVSHTCIYVCLYIYIICAGLQWHIYIYIYIHIHHLCSESAPQQQHVCVYVHVCIHIYHKKP